MTRAAADTPEAGAQDIQGVVYERLTQMGLRYTSVRHAPVHTMEDCAPNAKALHAVMPKNLFLCPRNGSAYVLAVVRPDAVFHTADVSKQLRLSRLSFAPPEKLWEYLRTEPGAISPMGLLFDEGRNVRLAIDRSLLAEKTLAFHPCVNTETLALEREDFFSFLRLLDRDPEYIDLRREPDHIDLTDEACRPASRDGGRP